VPNILQDAGSGKAITVTAAPPQPKAAPAKTVPYNPAGYVPGGSSVAVGKAIEVQAITTPGPTPVQVPVAIEQGLPPIKPAAEPPVSTPAPPKPPAAGPPGSGPQPPESTAPAPVEPTPNTSGVYTHLELEQLWALANGEPLYEDTAAAIAQAESGGHANDINNTAYPEKPHYSKPKSGNRPEYSVGLWQINMLAHTQYTEAELLTATGNAKAAVEVSNRGLNFTPWSTYNDKEYEKYLTGATKPAPVPPASTPTSTKPPARVQASWDDVITVYSTGVPKQRDQVRNLAASLVTIFQG
jgi:hypothetical protein